MIFKSSRTIRSVGSEIYNNDLSLDDAFEQQVRLKDDIEIFKESTKSKESVKKVLILKIAVILINEKQKVLNALKWSNSNKKTWKSTYKYFKSRSSYSSCRHGS